MSLPLRKPKTWPYATGSTGRLRGSLPLGALGLRVQVYEAVGEARKSFIDLSKDIVNYLDANASEARRSGSYVGLSLFMVGRSPERTKPMVMIVSEDKNARLEAFRLVKKSGIHTKYPGFEIGHMPLKAEFENLQPLGGAAGPSQARAVPSILEYEPGEIEFGADVFSPVTDLRTEGRRLRAWLGGRATNEKPQSATAGGFVEFNGEFYIHTVAHLLRPTTPAATSAQDEEWDGTGLSDFEEDGDDDLVQVTSRGSLTPEGSVASESGMNSDDGSFDSASPKHSIASPTAFGSEATQSPGEHRDHGSNNIPESEAVVRIGSVSLVSHAHDSVFIHLNTIIPGLSQSRMLKNAIQIEDFTEEIETAPADTAVWTTIPNGVVAGTLTGTPSYFRLPHATTFQQVYIARMEKPLGPGDCGSWIRNAATGKLFGHVVAGSSTTGLAIIMPAINTFTHAREVFHSRRPATQGESSTQQSTAPIRPARRTESQEHSRSNPPSSRYPRRGSDRPSYNHAGASNAWRPPIGSRGSLPVGSQGSYQRLATTPEPAEIIAPTEPRTLSEKMSDFWWQAKIWARTARTRIRRFIKFLLSLVGHDGRTSQDLVKGLWSLFSFAFVFFSWVVPKIKSWFAARAPQRIPNRQTSREADEAGNFELGDRTWRSGGRGQRLGV
ncbi:hypothetical protein QBC34DRAFT_406784 [Podospora aff. communis PSN243]|uniref:Uncharacterized protein n=1 Tax=Podospora aff. communis PSN243 TaxID=3040156 RepID=A0AAV9GK88_9PEZI|nr:hypothetical protein QBC34DRAFT_406784 [Podospora aff. communis PSN243]